MRRATIYSMTTKKPPRRAIGIIRVSEVGDREGESFHSPAVQQERIEAACERDGLTLLEVVPEMNVSGGDSLARRHGLRRAVERIEAGEAEVVTVAYFDRLFRSLRVQAEVVERVEAAGGSVLAVDVGQVTNGSAGQWLSATMLGAVSEYARRSTAERTEGAKRRAVERGVPPFPNLPPGLRRSKSGGIERDRKAPAVVEAFRLRAGGATIQAVRAHLRRHGIDRSFHAVQAMLQSRLYLGELRFGETVNERSHAALVDADTFARVQRMVVSRGRRGTSERLLARLGVLRCGTCGSRMSVGSTVQNGRRHHFYRCSPTSDCSQRVTISATVAERITVEAAQGLLAGMCGSASVETGAAEAEQALEHAQADLDAAIRAFGGFEDESATRERLTELRDIRDDARRRLDELSAAATVSLTVDPSADWDLLTLDERRALIRAVVERVNVAPGRSGDRITVESRS